MPRRRATAPMPSLFDKLQDDLGVAFGGEDAALPLQIALELAVIVDLTVEDDGQPAGRTRHRLVGARIEIDDRQPPMAEDDAVGGIAPLAFGVRPPPRHGLGHARDRAGAFTGPPAERSACYAAHAAMTPPLAGYPISALFDGLDEEIKAEP